MSGRSESRLSRVPPCTTQKWNRVSSMSHPMLHHWCSNRERGYSCLLYTSVVKLLKPHLKDQVQGNFPRFCSAHHTHGGRFLPLSMNTIYFILFSPKAQADIRPKYPEQEEKRHDTLFVPFCFAYSDIFIPLPLLQALPQPARVQTSRRRRGY